MEVRSLAYRTDLMVRRLAGSTIVDHGRHLVVRTPANPGYHWGNFLLLDDLPVECCHRPLDRLVPTRNSPGPGHLTLGIDGTEFTGIPLPASVVDLEVDLGEVLVGRRPPASGPVADGIVVRPLRTSEDWHQELQLRREEALEDGPPPPGHAPFLERSTAEAAGLVASGGAEYFGAFDADRLCSVAGIASDRQGVARYQRVGTLAEYRQRGLASRLLAEAGAFAVDSMGADLLVIVADLRRAGGPSLSVPRLHPDRDRPRAVGLGPSGRAVRRRRLSGVVSLGGRGRLR